MSLTRFLFDKKFIFPNDLERLELKGKVKELIIRFDKKYYTDLLDNTSIRGFESEHQENYKDLFFNSRGNLKEEIHYEYFDEIEFRSYFNYNERNELLSKIVEGKGIMNFVEKYKYHYFFNQIQITNSWRKDSIRKIKFRNGNISEDIYIPDPERRYSNKTTYRDGKPIVNDSLIRTTMIYDFNGNLVRKDYSGIFDKNTVYRSELFEFNDHNQIVGGKIFDRGRIDSFIEFDYDENGNWIGKRTIDLKNNVLNEIKRMISYYTTENS